MKVSVLGPLEVTDDSKTLTPSAPKLRSLLALLALRHDHVVTRGALMEELWGDDPPISALATLQTYIYQLRRLLAGVRADGREVLVTKPLGYVVHLGPDDLDLEVFERLVEQGREALEDGSPERAAALLSQALRMSTVSPLSDVDAGPVLSAHVNQLNERKLQAVELRIEADLQLGRHRELISELKALTVEHPFHEYFCARLMVTLERSGRRSEALEAYQNLRRTLVSELGIEPSASLRGLQEALLAADSEPSRPPQPAMHLGGVARPAQLPSDIGDFIGHADAVRELESLVTQAEPGGVTRLMSVTGMAGVGKSVFAVRVAHRIRALFPDGQFHAELGGSSERPADPFTVLGGFLRAIGLLDRQLPESLEERSQLLRSWTAERAVLVVLDDVASASQVRPLLPGGSRCAVLLTSRSPLPELAGAHVVELEELGVDECVELLGSIAGEDRVAAEPETAQSIVRMCGQVPLAVRAVAAKLRLNRRYPLRRLATKLRDPYRRLDQMRLGELDVCARLAPGFHRLDQPARHTLRCLARGNAGAWTGLRASKLTGLSAAAAEDVLERLAQAAFLRMAGADEAGETLFILPDLVRSFVLSEEIPGVREAGARESGVRDAVAAAEPARPQPDDPVRLDGFVARRAAMQAALGA
jgi:DNA-binding SARP family transcriptional activator